MITLFIVFVAIAGFGVICFDQGWTNETFIKRNSLVFDGRNKEYGAYALRTKYNDHLLVAFGVLFVVLMAFVSGNLIWKNLSPTQSAPVLNIKPDSYSLTEMNITEIFNPPLAQTPSKIEKVMGASNPDKELVDPIIVNTSVENSAPSVQDQPQGTSSPSDATNGTPNGQSNLPNNATSTDIILIPDVQPSFINGYDALLKYLASNIIYPDFEKDNNIQGTVYLSFVVSATGQIEEVKEMIGVKGGPNLSKEAIRVVKKMPHWNPGMVNGKPVNVRFTLPIKFVLR